MTRTVTLRLLARVTLIASFLLAISAGCRAQDSSAIQGSLYIAGTTPSDPPPKERKDTHAYLAIHGEGAIRMYRAMRARVREDACRGDGWKIKRAKHLACSISRDGNQAECDFSVDLRRGNLAAGNPC